MKDVGVHIAGGGDGTNIGGGWRLAVKDVGVHIAGGGDGTNIGGGWRLAERCCKQKNAVNSTLETPYKGHKYLGKIDQRSWTKTKKSGRN